MAAAFQVVLFLLEVVNRRFGNAGLLASAFALGLTDVDALTASMTSRVSGGLAAEVGAVAIATGILSNSLTKLGDRTGHRSRALPSVDGDSAWWR